MISTHNTHCHKREDQIDIVKQSFTHSSKLKVTGGCKIPERSWFMSSTDNL